MKFITDTSGNKSLTATLAVISFIIVMFKVLFSGAAISVGSFSYSFGSIDGFTIGAIFAPVMGTYTARRWGSSTASPPPGSPGGHPGDGAA